MGSTLLQHATLGKADHFGTYASAADFRATTGASGAGSGKNVIEGFSGNTIDASADGCTISGGGTNLAPNEILAPGGAAIIVSTIGGGYDNIINTSGVGANTIAGGAHHRINGTVTHATIAGGSFGTINTGGDYCAISGGTAHTVSGTYGTISGGQTNTVSANYGSIGGGQINTASGVNSTVAGGASNTASGAQATVGGGQTNTAVGPYSTVAGGNANACNSGSDYTAIVGGLSNTATARFGLIAGRSNTVSKDYGVALGFQALARSLGTVTHASGMFSIQGDAQEWRAVARYQTANATPREMFLDGTTATERMVLADDSSWAFRARLVARNVASPDDTSVWELTGAIRRGSGAASTTLVGSVTSTLVAQDAGASAWTVGVTADTTNGSLKITVTGDTKTINWVAMVQVTEVRG